MVCGHDWRAEGRETEGDRNRDPSGCGTLRTGKGTAGDEFPGAGIQSSSGFEGIVCCFSLFKDMALFVIIIIIFYPIDASHRTKTSYMGDT